MFVKLIIATVAAAATPAYKLGVYLKSNPGARNYANCDGFFNEIPTVANGVHVYEENTTKRILFYCKTSKRWVCTASYYMSAKPMKTYNLWARCGGFQSSNMQSTPDLLTATW